MPRHLLALPCFLLMGVVPASGAVPAQKPRSQLTATCLGAAAPGSPLRVAVSWKGELPLEVLVWGDADGDRERDAGEDLVATRSVPPGYTVIELDWMPSAALAVGPAEGSAPGVAALLVDGCSWSGEFFFADFDGAVRAFAAYDDGTGSRLYVAGEFLHAADSRVNHIAAWDGATWSALAGPEGEVGANALVRALVVYASSLYVGGDFTTAGGVAASRLARWNASGWANVGDFDGPVHALASFGDVTGTRLYVGGAFHQVGDLAVSHIARRTGTTWEVVGSGVGTVPGVDGPVHALERCTDGGGLLRLFVGGDFDNTSEGAALHIARWNGSSWSSLGSGASNGVSGPVRALECESGVLYVGGDFQTAGNGIEARSVASWSGAAWSALGTGMFFPTGDRGQVLSLLFYDDGTNDRLYAGGWFDYAGGQPAKNLAVWNGASWSGMVGSSMAGMDGEVEAFGTFGGELYAGGSFTAAGGAPVRSVARWNGLSTESWRAVEDRWGWGFSWGAVRAWAVYDEGDGPRLFAGGEFVSVGPVAAYQLARWDGTAWTAVESTGGPRPGGPADYVTALAVHDDGAGSRLFVGLSGWPSPGGGVVAWDGADWAELEGLVGDVYALETFGAGAQKRLYAGGALDEIDGEPVAAIARWNGSAWSDVVGVFSPVNYIEQGAVYDLAVFDSGSGARLYAGGNFSMAQGSSINLAHWDGANWSGVGSTGPDARVSALAVFDDGSGPALFLGGDFTHVDALAASHMARWSGAAWSALSGPAGNGTSAIVYDLGTYDDGSGPALYATGPFVEAGGVPVGYIARWDGAGWSGLPDPSGVGLDDFGLALIEHDDGRGPALWVGGAFDTAGGKVSKRAARWTCGLLFKDGFESGAVSAWDAAAGLPGGP